MSEHRHPALLNGRTIWEAIVGAVAAISIELLLAFLPTVPGPDYPAQLPIPTVQMPAAAIPEPAAPPPGCVMFCSPPGR